MEYKLGLGTITKRPQSFCGWWYLGFIVSARPMPLLYLRLADNVEESPQWIWPQYMIWGLARHRMWWWQIQIMRISDIEIDSIVSLSLSVSSPWPNKFNRPRYCVFADVPSRSENGEKQATAFKDCIDIYSGNSWQTGRLQMSMNIIIRFPPATTLWRHICEWRCKYSASWKNNNLYWRHGPWLVSVVGTELLRKEDEANCSTLVWDVIVLWHKFQSLWLYSDGPHFVYSVP